MRIINWHKNAFGAALFSGIVLLTGCRGCGDSETPDQDIEEVITTTLDSNKSAIFSIGDELFSIPSPIQTAFLIKSSGANYNTEMLNQPGKEAAYATKVQRSLNLGVYGADLGYVTIYDQTQDAIKYLNSTKKLADELGVASAFDASLIERFQKNLGNQDSMLALVSDAYRASDAYLKNNERDDVGSLILAGGWIEAFHFAVSVAEEAGTPDVMNRVGEQKGTLENLIKLLQKYANNEELADLTDQLIELYYLFDEIKYTYEFAKPTTYEKNKLTVINSTSSVDISSEQLKEIANKIQSIRNQIVE